MKKWIGIVALGMSMLAVPAAQADAAEASYRPVGIVHGLKVQAGEDTSAAYARKVASVMLRNSCEGSFHRITSPTNCRTYRLRCLTIQRFGYTSNYRDGWTVPVWGGRGDNGSVIRVRVWAPGQAN
jgi:hypothetical protein